MKINDIIHGFKVINKCQIKEAESVAYTFEHVKTGAKLFFLQNDDDNKVFSITFRTPPVDDTGVAHIVEHSTLCGSRKYPLKEPFVELVKGSLNTFLNAMTYPDKTMYPVASRNDKDFQNLMDVYLDAVFYPAMRENPQVLMQEGWHYEIEKPEDPLTYSGVVYNEMKGATSSPDDLLETQIMAALYPNTTYGYESGGNPEAIPTLTQEKFISFHNKYYHPSNSYIYLYGDMDIEEKLAYLDSEYLSAFDKIDVSSKIDLQDSFKDIKRVEAEYPVSDSEEMKDKTFLSLNWVVGNAMNVKDMMGLEILEHALLRTPAAPLRKVLIDAHIGKDVDTILENEILQPFCSIVVSNSEADRSELFYKLVYNELKRLVSEGIDKTLLEASLNLMEFRLRESDFGSAPKGLIYGIRIMRTWLYDGAPESVLYYEKALKELKQGLDEGYFEDLIKRYLLTNKHAALLTMKPSKNLAKERESRQQELLAAQKAAMSEDEIAAIIAATKALKQHQQQPDSEEALKTIPVLNLSDIRKEAYDLPLTEHHIDDVKILFSDIETSGIVYLTFFFDTSTVPQDKLPYLYLLVDLLGQVDTDSYSYAELANLKNLYTGGIDYDVTAYTKKAEPDSCLPKLRIRAKVLREKLPKLFWLLKEIIVGSQFVDEKRILELIEQEQATMEMDLQRSAHQLVAGKIAAYLSPAGRYIEEGSLPFYKFIKNMQTDFAANIKKMQIAFTEIMPKIFNTNNMIVSVTAPRTDYDAFATEFKKFKQELCHVKVPAETYNWDIKPLNEGLTSSSRVQYVGKGANFLKLGYDTTGTMNVAETLLRYDYFWTKIRVQGGAYGAFTHFDNGGFMMFGSYRDPNLAETLQVFDGTGDYLRNFTASDREMTKFIIGTMSNVDTPLTPKMKGNMVASCYLRNVTLADRQKVRDEIISTCQEDIRALADLVDKCMQENVICVFGGQAKVEANKALFGAVKPAL